MSASRRSPDGTPRRNEVRTRPGGDVTGLTLYDAGFDSVDVEFDRSPRPVVTRLTVRNERGVSGDQLRRLPGLVERARVAGQRTVDEMYRPAVARGRARTELLKMLEASDPAHRRGLPDRFYKVVASLYLAYVDSGVRTPSATIAQLTGAPLQTVQGWVRRARRKGHLPPARRGAAG